MKRILPLSPSTNRFILNRLRERMRASGMTYRKLGDVMGCSEITVKRLFTGQRLTLDKLYKVAQVFNLSLSELFHEVEELNDELNVSLSDDQELALASDFKLFSFFVMIAHRVPLEQIMSGFRIQKSKAEYYLLKLDSVGLVELNKNLKYRVHVSPRFSWKHDGPIQSKILNPLAQSVFKGYLKAGHERPHELFVVRMTSDLQNEFLKRFRKLSEELLIRALREDATNPKASNVGFMFALRPFEASVIRTLEKTSFDKSRLEKHPKGQRSR